MLELAETSPVHITKSFEMLMEQYKARRDGLSPLLLSPTGTSAAVADIPGAAALPAPFRLS